MSRLRLLTLLALITNAFAQVSAPETTPILKALPAEGDPNAPSKVAPATAALEGPLPSTDGKPTGDDAIRLQIFLDQMKFGPGVVDGKPGRFTELAVFAWNEVNGHPSDDWKAVMEAARKAVPNPLATAVVPDAVKDWVDPSLPTSRSGQATKKRMSYRSVAEFMSERYHCDVPYLVELNGAKKINNLKARDSIIVPNITPFHVEALTETKFEADPSLSARHVVVDTKINQVRIFEATPVALIVADPDNPAATPLPKRGNKGLVASFPITPGKPQFIRFGTWELKNMVVLPWWRYDESLLKTGKRSSNALMIPAGPNSPVGVIWCGTSRSGIGMHGTSDPETIGRARSAGCIRLANWDAIRLPEIIRPGSTVEIR
jgi:lipoprotein-anchoring transpeptidase ErfK/SrfK